VSADLRETARRLLERDAAEQGIAPVCDDPATLAAVAAVMRPAPALARAVELLDQEGGAGAGP
jgi:hypothetical protein